MALKGLTSIYNEWTLLNTWVRAFYLWIASKALGTDVLTLSEFLSAWGTASILDESSVFSTMESPNGTVCSTVPELIGTVDFHPTFLVSSYVNNQVCSWTNKSKNFSTFFILSKYKPGYQSDTPPWPSPSADPKVWDCHSGLPKQNILK